MKLAFAFDFISPYAYLGWHRAHAELSGVTVEPMPVLFAALLNAHGQKGPAEIPSKRIYTWKHVVRLAYDQGLPIAPPPAHPFNPLLALRIVALDMDPGDRKLAVDALFAATWGGGPGVADPATVTEVLEAVGLPGERWVAAAGEPAIKARVRGSTEAALAAGVFGVPSILIGDEVFWGQDAMPHVARYLAGSDPVSAGALERWRELPVGASR